MNNPFYWIVLLGGQSTIANRIIWMEVVKLLLTGFFSYRFRSYSALSLSRCFLEHC